MTEPAKDAITKDEAVRVLTEWNANLASILEPYANPRNARAHYDEHRALTTVLALMESHVLVPREVAMVVLLTVEATTEAVKFVDDHGRANGPLLPKWQALADALGAK